MRYANLLLNQTGGIEKCDYQNMNRKIAPLQERICVDGIQRWWSRRSVPLSQGKIRRILEEQGVSCPEEYLVKNLGLSLTDYYWIRPLDSELTRRKAKMLRVILAIISILFQVETSGMSLQQFLGHYEYNCYYNGEKLIMNFCKVSCHDLTVTERVKIALMDFYITGMEKNKDIISTSLQKIGRVSMRTESRYHLMNCIQEIW